MAGTRGFILIVEDDDDLRHLMKTYLLREGYDVCTAEDGEQAKEALGQKTFQLAVLDLMLPQSDGLEVLRYIREKGNTPVLIVSSKSDEVDKIVGLRMGADDYLTKPFGLGEFTARVQALLRRFLELNRPAAAGSSALVHGPITIDPDTREAQVNGEPVELTAKEFDLLKVLMQNPNRVFSKAQLFRSVWQQDYMFDENTIMVHIRRLRAKIEPNPSEPVWIQTVWGIGYKLGKAGDSPSSFS
ncbi:response regulator transcription factor [Paenibacillus ehimensis]|uniref:response regulator transcription factor n=1 Tax=Paenibacillus ehimensis TaxID=79264 RepID=UPI0004715595|nr:response regulator transcription factor [Paenibacillus ehimensis]MEC0214027.1 response regulator transcription factor [Paenibacillus ehimensis]